MFSVHFDNSELSAALGGDWADSAIPSGSVNAVFTDTRETAPDSLFLALRGETFDAHQFLDRAVACGARVLCIEKDKRELLPPGIPAVLVDSTTAAFQRLAHWHRLRFPALAIAALTGSCGKTSTKETLRAIFTQAYGADRVLATEGNTNNQIGVPGNLLRLTAAHRAAVIEMGTNHPGEIEPLSACTRPTGAMVVSIGNCHLEFLGSLEGVAREKAHIFQFMEKNGPAVIPFACAGGEILRSAANRKTTTVLTFGESPDADFSVRYLGGNLRGASFELLRKETGEHAKIDWSVPGRHQACNAAGAAALATLFGIPFSVIAEGIAHTTLPGLRMRLAEHNNSTWINDAYNANPDSMRASLAWLAEFADPARLVPVLGDMGELGETSEEGHRAVLQCLTNLFPGIKPILVGAKMSAAAKELKLDAFTFPDADAARTAVSRIPPGSLVFLKASRSAGLERMEPDHD